MSDLPSPEAKPTPWPVKVRHFLMREWPYLIMLVFALFGAYLGWRHHLFTTRWFLIALVLISPLGFVATIAGWVVTEAGRQPYVVYGVVRTASAASHLPAVSVGSTLILFIVAYLFLMGEFLWFLIQTIIRGPETAVIEEPPRAARGRSIPG